mmetsp:Transcript_52929/g.59161  ORF Transcript_52929/g.59161 Transcript_52929/m.59161 type:complete len:222 (+) Transcript_52929:337-1002(+)
MDQPLTFGKLQGKGRIIMEHATIGYRIGIKASDRIDFLSRTRQSPSKEWARTDERLTGMVTVVAPLWSPIGQLIVAHSTFDRSNRDTASRHRQNEIYTAVPVPILLRFVAARQCVDDSVGYRDYCGGGHSPYNDDLVPVSTRDGGREYPIRCQRDSQDQYVVVVVVVVVVADSPHYHRWVVSPVDGHVDPDSGGSPYYGLFHDGRENTGENGEGVSQSRPH